MSLPTRLAQSLSSKLVPASTSALPRMAFSTSASAPAPSQPSTGPAPLIPPFTLDTATRKVKMAQDAWNSCDPERVSKVYTPDSIWRNRDQFFQGREAIVAFLSDKWHHEKGYRLRKKLHSFHGDGIAVNFWYEHHDGSGNWFRTYGLEHWNFDAAGLMYKRHCSANEVPIAEAARWFKDGVDVDALEIDPRDG